MVCPVLLLGHLIDLGLDRAFGHQPNADAAKLVRTTIWHNTSTQELLSCHSEILSPTCSGGSWLWGLIDCGSTPCSFSLAPQYPHIQREGTCISMHTLIVLVSALHTDGFMAGACLVCYLSHNSDTIPYEAT